MNLSLVSTNHLLAAVLFIVPTVLNAQSNHDVMVLDNEFEPQMITIQEGDTVRWLNFENGGTLHDVVSEDGLWTPNPPAEAGTFTHKFTEAGTYGYYCSVHQAEGMTGVINVLAAPDAGVDFNAGHNGNWWKGPGRNGEGVQVELADADDGELVFVGTIYAYGPLGGQIFLIAVGTPVGDMVEVDVFITQGSVWGEAYDPDDVVETQWGTGVFSSKGCDLIGMVLTPNAEQQALGYTALEYDLIRLTTPRIQCPYE